jgi:hypothetical protein
MMSELVKNADQIKISRPYRLYCIGDSNCLAFRDLLVDIPYSQESAFFYTTYVPGLKAETIHTSKDGLHPQFKMVLQTYSLIFEDDSPLHLSYRFHVHSNIFAAGQALISPVILIIAGDIDLRGKIYHLVTEDTDVILPDEIPYARVPNSRIIPIDLVKAEIQDIVDSLVRGAAELQSKYGARVFIHGVNPPTLDEERFANINEYRMIASKRYKLSWLFNRLLEAECAENGIAYFDIWQDTTKDGYLRPEYELDGVHLAPEAVAFTLKHLFTAISLSSINKTNYVRYRMALPRAANRRAHLTDSDRPTFIKLHADTLRAEQFVKLLQSEGVATTDCRGNFDWVIATNYPAGMRLVELSAEDLRIIGDILESSPIAPAIKGFLGSDFICISCRLTINSGDLNGSAPRLSVAAPDGVIKAVLIVEGTDFKLLDPNDTATEAFRLSPGDLILYQPNALRGVTVGKSRVLELTLMPRLAGQSSVVVNAGINDWPADPFHYSLHGMPVHGAQGRLTISAPSIVYAETIGGEVTSDFLKESRTGLEVVSKLQKPHRVKNIIKRLFVT